MDAEEGLRVRGVDGSAASCAPSCSTWQGHGRPEHRAGILGEEMRPLALVTGASSGIGREIASTSQMAVTTWHW